MLAKVNHSNNHHYIVHCISEAILFGARLLHTRTAAKYSNSTSSSSTSTSSPFEMLLNGTGNAKKLNLNVKNATKNSRGVCLVSVNEAVQIGMNAFIDAFVLLNGSASGSGSFTPVIKILRSRLSGHATGM